MEAEQTKGRRWNISSALAYITSVKNGRNPKGLKYWSARDYMRNHHKPVLDSLDSAANAELE